LIDTNCIVGNIFKNTLHTKLKESKNIKKEQGNEWIARNKQVMNEYSKIKIKNDNDQINLGNAKN